MLDLIFLDFETTGLDPEDDAILEAFAQRVTVGSEGAVTRHESFHWLGFAPYDLTTLSPVVRQMHRDSGLIDALAALPPRHRAELDSELERALTAFIPAGAMLAGRSIHFDRSFIAAQLPMVHARLHHRMLDVTGLVTLAEAVGIVPPPGAIPAPNHRAAGDTTHAIESLRYLAPFLFLGGAIWREYRRSTPEDNPTAEELAAAAHESANRKLAGTARISCYPPPAALAPTLPPAPLDPFANPCEGDHCERPGCPGDHLRDYLEPAPLPREVPEGRKTDPIPPAIVPCPPTLRDVGARTSRIQCATPNLANHAPPNRFGAYCAASGCVSYAVYGSELCGDCAAGHRGTVSNCGGEDGRTLPWLPAPGAPSATPSARPASARRAWCVRRARRRPSGGTHGIHDSHPVDTFRRSGRLD